ncbi:hypothetical protein [Herbaspirillum seropedicae]|uniref:hypothetical protein n=1 Tax=Herbaspirillum seropedicae TaxID=964 RepID=UPI003F8CF393
MKRIRLHRSRRCSIVDIERHGAGPMAVNCVAAMQKATARFPARALKIFAGGVRQDLEAGAIIHTSMNVCISSKHHHNLANLAETA